jgi:hypothetical protein
LPIADSVSAADSLLRNKPAVAVADSLGLADNALVNKVLQVNDNVCLVEFVEGGLLRKNKTVFHLGRFGGAAYRRVGNLKFERD